MMIPIYLQTPQPQCFGSSLTFEVGPGRRRLLNPPCPRRRRQLIFPAPSFRRGQCRCENMLVAGIACPLDPLSPPTQPRTRSTGRAGGPPIQASRSTSSQSSSQFPQWAPSQRPPHPSGSWLPRTPLRSSGPPEITRSHSEAHPIQASTASVPQTTNNENSTRY